MNVSVVRNNQQYGPYDEQTLLSYVNSGRILLHDKAIAVGEYIWMAFCVIVHGAYRFNASNGIFEAEC